MRIRKILGVLRFNQSQLCIAKTESGKFVVGEVVVGLPSSLYAQFDTLEAAFKHWCETFQTLSRKTLPKAPLIMHPRICRTRDVAVANA